MTERDWMNPVTSTAAVLTSRSFKEEPPTLPHGGFFSFKQGRSQTLFYSLDSRGTRNWQGAYRSRSSARGISRGAPPIPRRLLSASDIRSNFRKTHASVHKPPDRQTIEVPELGQELTIWAAGRDVRIALQSRSAVASGTGAATIPVSAAK